jgi:hypothetical protein
MLKIYCSDCGNPTNYSSIKPKFCSNCGNLFDKSLIQKNNSTRPTQDKPVLPRKVEARSEDFDDDDYDDQEVNHVPEINQLDCEIVETRKISEKIGQIVGTSKEGVSKPAKSTGKKTTKAERKKFLEEFSKEAGALRPRSRGSKNG